MKENFEFIITDFRTHSKDIRAIRDKVFVVEQSVPIELEHDSLDESATHIVVYKRGKAVATGRILEDGHIGRIAVLKSSRGNGIGKLIMQQFFKHAKEKKFNKVWLSSQWHAHKFYCNLGFICVGEKYHEAGIEHIKMIKPI